MITPTISRIVHFYRGGHQPKPCAALIVDVLDDGKLNIVWWDHDGNQRPARRIQLVQGDEEKEAVWCEWPQRVQAKKAEPHAT